MPVKRGAGVKRYTAQQKADYYKKQALSARRQLARPTRPLKGRGAYRAPKSAAWGNKIASAIAGVTPLAPISGMIGEAGGWLGDKIGTLLGLGKYELRKNSFVLPEGLSPPSMHTRSGDTIIAHREYITDILTSSTPGAFNLQSFKINPGVSSTFPWLSEIASSYEEYEMLGCVFEFKSTSSDALNSTNTALGYVLQGTNYNAAAPNFGNKLAMLNTQYSTDCKPSQSCLHPIECDPHYNPMMSQYVRSGAVPVGEDPKTYDLGNYQIATGGMQAASVVIGELWVSYQIALRKPVFGPQQGAGIMSDHWRLASVSSANVMGTNAYIQPGSSINGSVLPMSYTFPTAISSGSFLFVWTSIGSAAAVAIPSPSIQNGSLTPLFNNGSDTFGYAPIGGVAGMTRYMVAGIVNVNAPGASQCKIIWSVGTIGAAGVGDFFVTAFNNTILSSVLPPSLEEADDETDDETDDPLDPDLASEERFHKILSDADQKGEHLTEHERTLMALRARIKALKRQQNDA